MRNGKNNKKKRIKKCCISKTIVNLICGRFLELEKNIYVYFLLETAELRTLLCRIENDASELFMRKKRYCAVL